MCFQVRLLSSFTVSSLSWVSGTDPPLSPLAEEPLSTVEGGDRVRSLAGPHCGLIHLVVRLLVGHVSRKHEYIVYVYIYIYIWSHTPRELHLEDMCMYIYM